MTALPGGAAFGDEVAARRALLAPTEKTARIANEAILRRAISHHQLRCLYQPIVELATGTIVGAEALLRWRHPEFGPVRPDDYVADAEATGVVALLGHFVLETACHDAARWPLGARGPIPVSVNISPCHLATGGLVDDVLGALHHSGLPPSRLVLELTEGAQIADLTSAADQLGALRTTGITVALDDPSTR
jgi:EAL domain-containing protein (putative c-di-GMP-specific phosphodiesterase class I)